MKNINIEKVHQKVCSLLLKTQKLLLDNLSKPQKMKIFSKGTEGKVTDVDVWLEKILRKV